VNEVIVAELEAIVRRVYERYQAVGYHTFGYWHSSTPEGTAALVDALEEFIEEHYPAEWAAAWRLYANDETVLPRGSRPQQEAPAP